MQINESQLLKRLLEHDKAAVQKFYRTYSPRLLRFISGKVGNQKDIEEIAQDTLFAFLEGARDFTQKCSISTYLCSIASRKIVDFYRKQKIKRIVFSKLPPGLEPFISELLDPQKIYDDKVQAERITSVFAQLDPVYTQILRLKYIEEKSVIEIAEILACSFKSAESLLFRARKAFVKRYTYGN